MVDPVLMEQAKGLSVEERLAIIGELWDSIDHDARPVSSAVAALVGDRVAEALTDPLTGRSWDEIKADWHAGR